LNLERLTLAHEIDETLACITGIATKAQRDKFFPTAAELALKSSLYEVWDHRLIGAFSAARNYVELHPAPSANSIPHLLNIFSRYLSGAAITGNLQAIDSIRAGLIAGKDQVKSQIGKRSKGLFRTVKDAFFGLLFGITEQHALDALNKQLILSAGGFFDDTMNDVVKKEMEKWFAGEIGTTAERGPDGKISRKGLVENLRKLVNKRLASDGEESLPRSYFEGLAEHFIVRARNFGSIFQAENLGVKKYKIQGILDHRTSPICKPLIEGDRTFELASARKAMNDILKERDLSELKRKHPFLTEGTALSADNPIPPLHWKCRSWLEFEI
jgi:hypothetical protein